MVQALDNNNIYLKGPFKTLKDIIQELKYQITICRKWEMKALKI